MSDEQQIPEDTNPEVPAQTPEEKREEIAAGHDATMAQMLPPPVESDPAAEHAQVLSEMAGALDEPKLTVGEEVAAIPTEDLGEEPERTTSDRRPWEEHAETLDEMSPGKDISSFGEDLNRFNAGEFDGGGNDFGEGGGEESSGSAMQQFTDADFENKSIVSEMLIDHARRVEDLNRTLELERL